MKHGPLTDRQSETEGQTDYTLKHGSLTDRQTTGKPLGERDYILKHGSLTDRQPETRGTERLYLETRSADCSTQQRRAATPARARGSARPPVPDSWRIAPSTGCSGTSRGSGWPGSHLKDVTNKDVSTVGMPHYSTLSFCLMSSDAKEHIRDNEPH